MNNEDARRLSPWLKRKNENSLSNSGSRDFSQKEVAEIVGTTPQTMSGCWVKRYKAAGLSALTARKRGPSLGDRRHLTAEQEKCLQKLISDKSPDQIKMAYVLWTRKASMELIEQEFDIKMPIRTAGEYLKRWGFTPQKPEKRAYEQNPKAVKRWLDKDYPKIQSRAKAEKAEIYWGDETRVCNDSHHERGYASKYKTPVVRLNAKRTSTNMISAVTNQGKVRFKVFEGSMNTDILIYFCQRLIKSAGRKV